MKAIHTSQLLNIRQMVSGNTLLKQPNLLFVLMRFQIQYQFLPVNDVVLITLIIILFKSPLLFFYGYT